MVAEICPEASQWVPILWPMGGDGWSAQGRRRWGWVISSFPTMGPMMADRSVLLGVPVDNFSLSITKCPVYFYYK